MNAMGRAAGRNAAAADDEQDAEGARIGSAVESHGSPARADAPRPGRGADAVRATSKDTGSKGSPRLLHADDAVPTPRTAPVPVIETERMRLRPLAPPDAGLLTVYSGDERVAKATRSVPHPLPPGTAEGYIARANAAHRVEEVWALDASHHGLDALLGVISLRPLGNAQSEISYWVAPAFWNTGYASEAVRALVAANPLGDSSFFAVVFQDNPASARVLTNAGFDYLGDAEAFSVARDAMVRTWTYIRKLPPGEKKT